MFCFTLESICALAATPDFVLVPLRHCSFAAGWGLQLTTLRATSVHPGACILCSRFMTAITLKQPLLALLPASKHTLHETASMAFAVTASLQATQ